MKLNLNLYRLFVMGLLLCGVGMTLQAGAKSKNTSNAHHDCRAIVEQGRNYIVCEFRVDKDQVRLFWKNSSGDPYVAFGPLARSLEKKGKKLLFAMSAGPFHPDLSPVGLFAEGGKPIVPVNTDDGIGNFFTKPNGVFYWGEGHAGIIETTRFIKEKPAYEFATQSGPMMVIQGKIDFNLTSKTSEKLRNGVGLQEDGKTVVFAISNQPVTFAEFSLLFRDRLGCDNALFLNGTVSSLYSPTLKHFDLWLPLGPIVGVVK